MDLENNRAKEMGYESPIHESIDATHECFDDCVSIVLGRKHISANLMVATHNQSSIEHTIAEMQRKKIPKEQVYFGQLLGMADHLTYTLGANGRCSRYS